MNSIYFQIVDKDNQTIQADCIPDEDANDEFADVLGLLDLRLLLPGQVMILIHDGFHFVFQVDCQDIEGG